MKISLEIDSVEFLCIDVRDYEEAERIKTQIKNLMKFIKQPYTIFLTITDEDANNRRETNRNNGVPFEAAEQY